MGRDHDTDVPPHVADSAPVLNDPEKGTGSRADSPKEKEKGHTLRHAEALEIPHNNFYLVIPSLLLVMFLSALDQTIIATALPTIAERFDATPSEYSWVVTAYQLAMTLLSPANGRVSDIIGRKVMLYGAIICFTVFSAVCGAATSMKMLIIARAFQGLGGGSIISLVAIVISDITPMEKRAAYQGFMGAAWGIAAAVGPIMGGALTQHVSWRWCFYINLPTCAVAFIALALTLNLNKPKSSTFADLRRTFDFAGLFLLMAAGALLIVGFSFAADHGFDEKSAIATIVVGGVLFCLAIVNCFFTKRQAVIPARVFKTRTTLFFMMASTIQAAAFIPSNILLPQFFQGVRGANATESGIQLIPFAVLVSMAVMVSGLINTRLRIVRPIVWSGYALGILSFGLLYGLLNWDISLGGQYGLTVLAGLGCGFSLQTPLIILQAAMPPKEVAATTAAYFLTRSLGGSIGVSLLTAVLNTNLRSRFQDVNAEFGGEYRAPTSAAGYEALHGMPDSPLKRALLAAFADSFKPCWLITMCFFIYCLVSTLWTKAYSMRRPGAPPTPAAASPETTKMDEAEAEAEAETDAFPSSDEKLRPAGTGDRDASTPATAIGVVPSGLSLATAVSSNDGTPKPAKDEGDDESSRVAS